MARRRTQPKPLPAEAHCAPFAELLGFLGRRHVLELLYVLGEKSPQRFNELQAMLGITPKSLTSRLDDFEAFGLVRRQAYNEIPPRVEYALTEKGRALRPLFKTLLDWHLAYGEGPAALRAEDARVKPLGNARS